jgi:hypothetical protein
VQAALNAAGNGQKVVIPYGTVLVADLTVPTGVIFDCRRATLKAASSLANAVVTLGNNSRLKGGVIDMTSAGPSTYGVEWGASSYAVAEQVRVQGGGRTTRGYHWNGASRPTMLNCDSDGQQYAMICNSSSGTDGLVVGGTHNSGGEIVSYTGAMYLLNMVRCKFINVVVNNAQGHGWYIGGSSSDSRFTDCDATYSGTGSGGDYRGFFLADTATGNKLEGCLSTNNCECGFYANTTGTGNRLIGCSARANNTGNRPGGHGFELDSPGTEAVGCYAVGQTGNAAGAGCGFYAGAAVLFDSCRAETNYSDGYRLNASKAAAIGCTARNNSQRIANGHQGFRAFGTITDVRLIGNLSFDDQGTKTQQYGMTVETGVDFAVVTGNITRTAENATGGLLNQAGVNSTVANNVVA